MPVQYSIKNSISSINNLRERFFAAFLLIFFILIYYNSVVFQGNSFLTTVERSYKLGHYHYSGIYWHVAPKLATIDPAAANQINLPTAYLETHYLKAFQFPLWNPYSVLGRPYIADMNSYTFFLPIYLFKLFPSVFIYDLFLLLRLFISGFFLFLLLRLYRCQFWIAIAGASFYIFNSHFHAFIDLDHLNVSMLLSPMIYFLTKFLFSTNKRYLVGFIFCSAGSFYGGNPNEFILIHLFITVYFFFLIFTQTFDLKKRLNFLLFYCEALGLSFLLSSIKLIPFIEFWINSVSNRTGSIGINSFLPLKKFLSLILIPNQLYNGPNYIGYLIISLMFYSFFNLARRKWRFREKIVAFHIILLFLFISKINNAPYIKWIGTFPIFNNIDYVKYCAIIYYLIAVISSFALVYLREDIKTRNKTVRLSIFLISCIIPHFILQSISKESFFQMADDGEILLYVFIFFILISFFLIIAKKTYKNRVIIKYAMAILMLLAVFELRLNNHQYYRKRFRIDDKAPYTQFLLEQKQPYRAIGLEGTFSPNHNLVYPISNINRMFAMRIMRSEILLSKLISNKFSSGGCESYVKDEVLNNPYLDMLNTKYYISESILDSIVINPDFANSHTIKALLDNPLMQYTHCGNSYFYGHWGWQQLSDSSLDIPILLPYGDIYLKSTALAYNFDWMERENPENRLLLIISIKQNTREEILLKKTYIAHKQEISDFFNIKINLSKYAGQNAVLNFTLKNPGAKNRNDRTFFFGNLRITYNKRKKMIPTKIGNLSYLHPFETVPYEDVFSHHAIVYRNNRALERGFVLYNVKKVKDIEEAITIMKNEPFIYKNTALIEGNFSNDLIIGKKGQSTTSFLDIKPNYIRIDLETTENGIFILSDAYYPGWEAFLNKKQVKIFPAFGALKAVFLPKGKHELIFCYRPWTFLLGAVLAFLSISICGYLFFKGKSLK